MLGGHRCIVNTLSIMRRIVPKLCFLLVMYTKVYNAQTTRKRTFVHNKRHCYIHNVVRRVPILSTLSPILEHNADEFPTISRII